MYWANWANQVNFMNSGIWLFWLVSEVRVNWVVWSGEMGKKIVGGGLGENWAKNWAKKLGTNWAKIGQKWAEKNLQKIGQKN